MTFNAQFFVSLTIIGIVLHIILLSCAYLIFLERKVAAWTQDRIGPNRTNFSFGLLPFKARHFGLGQALADGIKLFFKEDYTPPHVDRGLFILAPALAVVPAMIAWAVIPWGGYWDFPGFNSGDLWLVGGMMADWIIVEPGLVTISVAPLSVGVLFLLAMSSIAVYGVTLAGYSSNNKYSFFGGMRATAQMLSYEIPMGLIVLVAILTYTTLDPALMAVQQTGSGLAGMWGILQHPLLAAIFFVCILAECNRAPFDLAEAEQELVGGFHTEYSSMKWALFFLGEYMHMITGCAFFVILFLGGWDLLPLVQIASPVTEGTLLGGLLAVMIKFSIFAGKVALLLFLMMWIRWTLPRLRFDQLMKLAWRGLIPICLLVLLLVGTIIFLDLPAKPLWFLASNILVTVMVMVLGPLMPGNTNMNRRIPLEGSRFSPKPALQAEA